MPFYSDDDGSAIVDGGAQRRIVVTAGRRDGVQVDPLLGRLEGIADLAVSDELEGTKAGYTRRMWRNLSTEARCIPLVYDHYDDRILGAVEELYTSDSGPLMYKARLFKASRDAHLVQDLWQQGKLFSSVKYEYEQPSRPGEKISYINLRHIAITDSPVVESARVTVLQSTRAASEAAAASTNNTTMANTDSSTPMETGSSAPAAAAPSTNNTPTTPAQTQTQAPAPSSGIPAFGDVVRENAALKEQMAEKEALAQEALAARQKRQVKEAAKRVERQKRVAEEFVPVLAELKSINPDDEQHKALVDALLVDSSAAPYQTHVVDPLFKELMETRKQLALERQRADYHEALATPAKKRQAVGSLPTQQQQQQQQAPASSPASSLNTPFQPSQQALQQVKDRMQAPRLPSFAMNNGAGSVYPQHSNVQAAAQQAQQQQSQAPQQQQQQQQSQQSPAQPNMNRGEFIRQLMRSVTPQEQGTLYDPQGYFSRNKTDSGRLVAVQQSQREMSTRIEGNVPVGLEYVPLDMLQSALAPIDTTREYKLFLIDDPASSRRSTITKLAVLGSVPVNAF